MDITSEKRAYIDSLPYGELLRRWRTSPSGDPWFSGETGEYWGRRMAELRAGGADHVAASKAVGWSRPPGGSTVRD